jgi:hypothetical protein
VYPPRLKLKIKSENEKKQNAAKEVLTIKTMI